jgi:hypothetical protein
VSHPEPARLLDLARGVLTEAEAGPVWQHVDHCGGCRLSLDRLSLVLRAIAAKGPSSDALERACTVASPVTPPSMVRARLVFDNLLRPMPAGIRGGGGDRHLLFEAGHWMVDLRLSPGEGTLGLTGQLANSFTPSRPSPGVPILARSGEAIIGRTLTTAWGEFSLDCGGVTPLTLEVLVAPSAIEIQVTPLASWEER